ncbi:hypothetical protein FRX31_012385 [Thalictrum thalictroides]|uniref:F-box domain-containing protein n=1 Tax=Thalictrum thalictroides TaxID=46969 RepID=A0A7J6WN55_THATH|nr:hypothetical protein FRX31_012385 [Thalictrum thalictroides]
MVDLPEDIINHIVSYLSMKDIARMRVSSKIWRHLCYITPYIQLVVKEDPDISLVLEEKLSSLCCELRMSDTCQGDLSALFRLNDIKYLKLYTHCSDIEMEYIAALLKKLPNLKVLAIDKSSSNDFKKFPQSETSLLYWESQNLEIVRRLQSARVSFCYGEDNAIEFFNYLIKKWYGIEVFSSRSRFRSPKSNFQTTYYLQ